MNYTNPFKRFLFRSDLLTRVSRRLSTYKRKALKEWEDDLGVILKKSPPRVIFDVGANVGFVTWQLTRLFPQTNVYAFEPDPATFRVLQDLHGHNPRIHSYRLALSDGEGDLSFVQRATSCTSSLLASQKTGEGDKMIRVRATTLDKFCAESMVEEIDVLKIDTEGADLRVLHGAASLLGAGRIKMVVSEALFEQLYEGQAYFDEIAAFLRSHGFSIFNVYIGGETKAGRARFANVLYLGKSLQNFW